MRGLYFKISEHELAFAAGEIHFPDGTIIVVPEHENAIGEVKDGWYWFNSRDEAKAALGVSDPVLPEVNEFLMPPVE